MIPSDKSVMEILAAMREDVKNLTEERLTEALNVGAATLSGLSRYSGVEESFILTFAQRHLFVMEEAMIREKKKLDKKGKNE